MTQTGVAPVLVTGATGRVGRVVIDLLVDAGVPVRALTHRSESAAAMPANSLFWWAAAIRADGVVRWPYGAAETAPVDDRDVAAVAARTLYQDGHAGGDYVLTGPESLSQAEQVSIIGDVLGRRIEFAELTPDEFRSETEGSWPRPVVDMLLDAWGATIGRPAFITSTVADILGSAPRSFRQWAADNANSFMEHGR